MNTTAQRIAIDHVPAGGVGVYQITCIPTGECYVGGSADLRARASQHASRLAYSDHYSKLMQSRYDEHGPEAFRLTVIDSCDLFDLSSREAAWIERLTPAFNVNRRVGIIRQPKPQPKPRVARTRVRPKSYRKSRAKRERIAQAVRAGMSVVDAQIEFSASKPTVYKAMREAGLSVRAIRSAERQKAVVELATAGKTAREISDQLGVCYTIVTVIMREAGLNHRPGPRLGTPNLACTFVPRDVWAAVDWTRKDADIAAELLVSRQRVHQVRHMLKKQAAA